MSAPFTIGITGGSGSGKTYFINNLSGRFRPEQICLVSQDHYYKAIDLQHKDAQGIENFDLPSAIDRKKMHEDILKIKKGISVRIQEYTFNNPAAIANIIEFRPAPLLIIEGLFVLHFEEIARELDLKIFIEAEDHIKLGRRIKRDNDERGYDMNDVLYRYQNHVMPVYESIIEPLKHNSDMIIPNNHNFAHAIDILALALKAKLSAGESKSGL